MMLHKLEYNSNDTTLSVLNAHDIKIMYGLKVKQISVSGVRCKPGYLSYSDKRMAMNKSNLYGIKYGASSMQCMMLGGENKSDTTSI